MNMTMRDVAARFGVAAVLVGGVVAMTGQGWAQQAVAEKVAKAAGVAGEEAVAAKKQGGDGIRVHGHWVIDIRNPDGTVAKHLDFENSLTTAPPAGFYTGSTGDQLLAALLTGMGAPAPPAIALIQTPSPGTSIPANTDIAGLCNAGVTAFVGAGFACGMVAQAGTLMTSAFYSPVSLQTGLTSTVNFSPPVSWVLSGNFTVPASGFTSLTAVQTIVPVCMTSAAYLNQPYTYFPLKGSGAVASTSVAANTCTLASLAASKLNPTFGPLTQTVVPGAPVAVVPNQILTITVTISFS